MITKSMSLTMKVLIGMLLGIATGLAINLTGLNDPGSFVNTYVVEGAFYVVGKMFVNALKFAGVFHLKTLTCSNETAIFGQSTSI